MKNDVHGKTLAPTVEQITAALRLCAVEEPAVGYPCEQCYLYPYSKDGRMSTGLTCFEHLVMDTCQLIDRLNNFDQTQSKIALERCYRIEAQLAASQRRERAAVELIDKVSQAVEVAFNATDYVKPNTGIWHTLGLAHDWINAWRGPQEAGKGEASHGSQ